VWVSAAPVRDLSCHLLRHGSGASSISLAARCCPPSAHRRGLTVSVERCSGTDALERDECPIRCCLRLADSAHPLAGANGHLTADELRAIAEARDARFAWQGTPNPGHFFAWAAVVAADGKERRAHIRLFASFPRWAFAMSLLATPLRTLQTPLLAELLSVERATPMGHGFLTLDRGRRAVCLPEAGDFVDRTPLVGVWVDLVGSSGAERNGVGMAWWDAAEVVDDPRVWVAAARFVHDRHIVERVWIDDKTFLVGVAHRVAASAAGGGCPRACLSFFEARYDDSAADAMLVAPADDAWIVDVDLTAGGVISIDGGTDAVGDMRQLSVRVCTLAESALCAAPPENPELDVPERCGGVAPPLASEVPSLLSLERPRQRPQPWPAGPLEAVAERRSPNSPKPKPPASPERAGTIAAPAGPVGAMGHPLVSMGVAAGQEATAGMTRWLGEGQYEMSISPQTATLIPKARLVDESMDMDTLRSSLGFVAVSKSTEGLKADSRQSTLPTDEGVGLRALLGAQQAQLQSLQQQLSDLHSIVLGLGNNGVLSAAARPSSHVGVGAVFHSGHGVSPLPQPWTCSPAVPPERCDAAVGVGESLQLLVGSFGQSLPPERRDVAVGDSIELPGGFSDPLPAPGRHHVAVGNVPESPTTNSESGRKETLCDVAVDGSQQLPIATSSPIVSAAASVLSAGAITSGGVVADAEEAALRRPNKTKICSASACIGSSPSVGDRPVVQPGSCVHDSLDSADTAGGATPRRRSQACLVAVPDTVSASHGVDRIPLDAFGPILEGPGPHGVPQIRWPLSASSSDCGSDIDSSLEDVAPSDACSADSSPTTLCLASG